MNFFQTESKSALESMAYAQWIAHAPIVFQAARVLRESGILQAIQDAGPEGITVDKIVTTVNLSVYGVTVLLESGLGSGILLLNEEKYTLTKTGFFILKDTMTRVNMDFVHDVCYNGLFHLEESIKEQKPVGLKVFGTWKTVYEALAHLPDRVQKSWFSFDHFYSDDAFPGVLPLVFKYNPKKILDIGGNTGKWALACCKYDEGINITIADLPGQLKIARQQMEKHNLLNRVSFYSADLLDERLPLPAGHDVIWMSQFLDCFSENEILSILSRCHDALLQNGHLFIMEPFWDEQRFKGAAFSLQQTSLYFTAIANGNSRMYRCADFVKYIKNSGFEIEEQTHQIGLFQSLLVCRKAS